MEIFIFVLLVVIFLVGLAIIPLGLPGLWLMVIAIIGYAFIDGFTHIGWGTIALVIVLAGIAEALEAWLGFRFARRFGASKRAGWGALVGGLIGAIVGTPVPLIGSVIGAFVGAFVGALAFEYFGGSDARAGLGAGFGAVLGKAAGAATKISIGIVIAVIGLFAALY
jgi:uncharacterized protein YqgC (DUF456 family)